MARLILKRNDVKLVHDDPTISPAGALAHNPAVIQRWDSVGLAPRINKRKKENGGGEPLNGKDLVRNECPEEREGMEVRGAREVRNQSSQHESNHPFQTNLTEKL